MPNGCAAACASRWMRGTGRITTTGTSLVQELYDVLRTPSFTGGEKAVMVHDVNPLDLPEAEQKKIAGTAG